MYRYRKYTEEQTFLAIAILVIGCLSFLMIFARAMLLGIEYMIQSGSSPLFVPITDYFTGLNLAFNIPTREVGYQYYVLMASFSYLIPLIFGILVNLRIKKIPKHIINFIAALFLIIVPIIYLISLNQATKELAKIIEIESLLIGKKYRYPEIKIETAAIIHAALSVIAGFLSIYAGWLSYAIRKSGGRK
jgi:hypothetical protein